MRKILAALAAAAFVLAGCSTMYGAPPPPTKVMDGVLTNVSGMTLYSFD